MVSVGSATISPWRRNNVALAIATPRDSFAELISVFTSALAARAPHRSAFFGTLRVSFGSCYRKGQECLPQAALRFLRRTIRLPACRREHLPASVRWKEANRGLAVPWIEWARRAPAAMYARR